MRFWLAVALVFAWVTCVDLVIFAKPDRMKLAGFEIVQVNSAPKEFPVVLAVKDCSAVSHTTRLPIPRYDWQSSDCRHEQNTLEKRVAEIERKSNFVAIARWKCPDCFGYQVKEITVFPSATGEPVNVELNPPVTVKSNEQLEVSFNLVEANVFKIPELK